MKIVKNNSLKSVIFPAVKNRCILHGRVCVMDQLHINDLVLLVKHLLRA